MKRRVLAAAIACAVAATLTLTLTAGCSTIEREVKSIQSDMIGGIDRTVILYSYNGARLASWHGMIDYGYADGRMLFDLDGRRVSIMGGIVVTEEAEYEAVKPR